MRLLFNRSRILLLVFFLFPRTGNAQEGTWSFSVFGGISAPRLKAVNETLDKTVRDWNARQIPISSIGQFSLAPSFGFRGSYRYDRDISASLSGSFSRQSLNTSYRDTAMYLNLDRSVQTTDIMLGLAYHFPPLLFDMEVSLVLDFGLLFASAEAVSYNTHEEKSGATTVTAIDYDSDAAYRKTKLIATAGAVWTWEALQPFFVKAEGLYRFGNMGKMNGEIRRLQGSFQEETITDFDFSGFTATIGIGIFF